MKTKSLLALLLAFALTSCSTPEEAQATTEFNMKNPDTVGTLPDGRVVKHFVRERSNTSHDHHIYFIENPDGKSNTISTNYSVSEGKTTRNETVVLIDGVKYVPLEKHEN